MAVSRRSAKIPWVLAAICLLGSAGCTPSEPAPVTSAPVPTVPTTSTPASTSTAPSSAPPSPTQSPSPSSTLTEDQAAAAKTVLSYFSILDELGKDPDASLGSLKEITTGQSLEVDISMIQEDREKGIVQTGDTRYYVQSVSPITEREGVRFATVGACTDSTETDLVDRAGKSVLNDDRAYLIEWTIEVLFLDSAWKVGDITNERVETCRP